MGLAPYGEPRYTKLIYQNLIDIKTDGSFRLNQSYFNYCTGLTMTNRAFDKLFGRKARHPDFDPIDQFHMDIAASIQHVTEDIIIKMVKSLRQEFNQPNLCLAGGVALNCVANGKILKEEIFENIWVQPAAGDAGGAVGAAYAAWHQHMEAPRKPKKSDAMRGSYLGPEYSHKDMVARLRSVGAVFEILEQEQLLEETVNGLRNDKAVGWFQGRMEFGPRALGNRSILANPTSSKTQRTLNLKIKYRESFRPFAPSILREHLTDWFEIHTDSPYMQIVASVNKNKRVKIATKQQNLNGIEKLNISRSKIPAVTHVDYSARLQTVNSDTNPKFHSLIRKFYEKTGVPILVNTSFNVRGEPIVCSPEDAFNCFMGTEMDMLVVGNCVLYKERQNKSLIRSYKDAFDRD